MKPTHTKFLSRYEAELLSAVCLATKASDIIQVWLGPDKRVGAWPTLEPVSTALISINSPDRANPKESALQDDGPPAVDAFWRPLRVLFHDVDPAGTSEEWQATYQLFNEEQAAQMLDYMIEVEQAPDVWAIWVHCQGGMSRSAGVAKFIAETYTLYWPERYQLYNKHVYSTLRTVYNLRVLTGKPVPGGPHV